METIKRIILLTVMVMTVFACQNEDRNTEELIDPWLRERTPTCLKVESQIGEAIIVDNWKNDVEGTITIKIIPTGIKDMSKVKVLDFGLQYNATASVSVGGTLDLSNGTDSIVVTAENGETRTYTVNYVPFEEEIVGTYKMDSDGFWFYGGIGPEYGGGCVWNINEKHWNWVTDPNNAELDNYFTLVLTGADENTGDTWGTCYNDAGVDGKYSDFMYKSSYLGATVDLSFAYRCIPEGNSTWFKNHETNEITFTSEDKSIVYTGILTGSGSYTLDQYKSVDITNMAFIFPCHTKYAENWDAIWADDAKYVYHPRNTILRVTKQ